MPTSLSGKEQTDSPFRYGFCNAWRILDFTQIFRLLRPKESVISTSGPTTQRTTVGFIFIHMVQGKRWRLWRLFPIRLPCVMGLRWFMGRSRLSLRLRRRDSCQTKITPSPSTAPTGKSETQRIPLYPPTPKTTSAYQWYGGNNASKTRPNSTSSNRNVAMTNRYPFWV